MLTGAISIVDQASGDAGLTFSFGVNSEAIEALSAAILGDNLAVGDVFDFEDGHTGPGFKHTVGLASDAVEIVVIFFAVGDGKDAFSIDEVEIFGADFASNACFLDAAFELDILAGSFGWVRLEASCALDAFALRVEGETAILGVLGRVVTKSA